MRPKLCRTERNYDVTRRELLAVVYGLKMYRQYLLGRNFVIRTDHSALQSLRKTPEPIGQQARWQTFIEQFSFSIVHRPGTRHRNADALSRRPVDNDYSTDEEPRQCKTVACRTEAVREQSDTKPRVQAPAGESLTKLQRQDPDSHIDKLKTWETDNPPKSWVTDDFDRRTDVTEVASDRDPDNGDVGINDPGSGGDG